MVLYCISEDKFRGYKIDGHYLNVEQNDKKLIRDNDKNVSEENMISPIIFTNWKFSNYLIYIFGKVPKRVRARPCPRTPRGKNEGNYIVIKN